MFHQITSKSSYVIYLLVRFVFKNEHPNETETQFNIRIDIIGKTWKNLNAIEAYKILMRYANIEGL